MWHRERSPLRCGGNGRGTGRGTRGTERGKAGFGPRPESPLVGCSAPSAQALALDTISCTAPGARALSLHKGIIAPRTTKTRKFCRPGRIPTPRTRASATDNLMPAPYLHHHLREQRDTCGMTGTPGTFLPHLPLSKINQLGSTSPIMPQSSSQKKCNLLILLASDLASRVQVKGAWHPATAKPTTLSPLHPQSTSLRGLPAHPSPGVWAARSGDFFCPHGR